METYFKAMLVLALFTLMAFSCAKEEIPPSAPVDFKFALINTIGEYAANFREGEAIIFEFIIFNKSNEDLYLNQSSFDTEEFLKVYRIETAEGNREIPVGKPYKSIFCTYQLGVLIPANDILKLQIPWVPDIDYQAKHFCSLENNASLPKGKYKTGFSSSFEFLKGTKSYKSDRLNFNINFEIK